MNLYEKLLEVKKQVPYLQKGTKAYQFNYASPETVLSHINPLLNDVGVMLKTEVIKTTPQRITNTKGKEETLYLLDMRMTWVNCADPTDTDENLWFGSGVNGDEQGFGSALTYAERYFMLKFFNIPTGKDDPDSFVDRQKERSNNIESSVKEKLGGKELKAGEVLNNLTELHKRKISKLEDVEMLSKYYKGLKPEEQEICVPLLAERKAEITK